MKIIVICLTVLLACSCRQTDDRSDPYKPGGMMTRDDGIQTLLKEHFTGYTGHEFEIRGPLTISQVAQELAQEDVDQAERTEKKVAQDALLSEDPDWKRFMRSYRRGGTIYYFESDKRSWAELHGRKGYVIIHKNRMTGMLVTLIN